MAARLLLLITGLLVSATPVRAEDQSRLGKPAIVLGGQFGTPTRLFGSVGVLVGPTGPLTSGTAPDSSRTGLLVKAGGGAGGFTIGGGFAALALEGPFLTTGFDALVTVTRTGKTPRAAAPDATYGGFEAGLVLMSVRLHAGVSHGIAGPTQSKATIFTWGIGVQIPLGW